MQCQSLILFFLIVFSISSGYGLKCYICNSIDDDGCSDPFDAYSASPFLHDCSTLTNKTGMFTDTAYCRKTTQKTSLRGMKDENKRVIRTCGHTPEPRLSLQQDDDPNVLKCFRRAGTADVEMNYCTCYKDECNLATQHFPSVGFLLLSSLTAFTISSYLNKS